MNLIKRILAFTAAIATALALSGSSTPQQNIPEAIKPVRIGYLSNYVTIMEPSQAGKRGYGYDFFAEIAKHTDWRYEYIPCGWEQGLQMLADGNIDIFGPLQKTPQREAKFLFPAKPSGYEFGVLYAFHDADVYYDDFDSFNGMTVGIYSGSYYNQKAEEYFDENGVDVTFVQANVLDSSEEFKAGKYNLLVTSSTTVIPDTKVVANLSTEEFYYAVSPGRTDILAGLDAAFDNVLKNDPYFLSGLHNKYYSMAASKKASFTKAEREIINATPTLRVAVELDADPMQYIDADTGKPQGVLINLLDAISAKCGIGFEYIPISADQPLSTAACDMSAAFLGKSDSQNFTGKSLPYHEAPMVFVGMQDKTVADAVSVALVENKNLNAELVRHRYPWLSVIPYSRVHLVEDALKSGNVDLALVSLYSYDEMARNNPYEQFSVFPSDMQFILDIEFSDNMSGELADIINKAIGQLSESEASSIVFSSTANHFHKPTLRDIIQSNALQIVVAAALVLLLMLFMVITIIRTGYTKRKMLQDSARALSDAAYVDSLTGASTLLKFQMDAEQLLTEAAPGQYSIIAMDVDNFKYINDTLGYNIGNHVLWLLAQIFKRNIHPDTLMARPHSDNFIFMYRSDGSLSAFNEEISSQAINDTLAPVLGNDCRINFSLGYYRVQNPSLSLPLMMDCANIAKKMAKSTYGSSIAEYTEDMDKQLANNREIILAMEKALINRNFICYLQPKVRLDTEMLCGSEVLVRWRSSEKGIISPGEFIPLFEKNGFICRLDLYMFEQTCMLLQSWLGRGIKNIPCLSVNVSAVTLTNIPFVSKINAIISQYGIEPSMIEVEFTESALGNSPALIMDIMSELKEAGFHVSIDDFGNGYSSLHLLKDASADVLKLDKGFLGQSMNTSKGKEIISSIISMAKRLHMQTVAEGVETREQAQSLLDMGCDVAQGYYYAKPMPAGDFERLLKNPSANLSPT